jgi:uncharacterized membrane protein YccC
VAARALVRLLRDAARLDRTQSDPVVALRNAIGIAVPLAVATLTGSTSAGLPSTIGALQTGFADRPGPYRLRVLRMLGTALAAAVTSALAIVCSRSDLASTLLLLVLAFAAGLLVTGGPSATQVGIAASAAALIIGHLPQPPGAAVHVGLLVLAGGAGQTLLAVAAWPLRRHLPERVALAGLYRDLAAAARRPGATTAGPQATAAVGTVRDTLYGLGHDHGPSVEAYRVLLDQAERIRREILVVAALVERLASHGAAAEAELVRTALTSCAGVLDEVAAALAGGRPVAPEALTPPRERLRTAVARLDEPAPSPDGARDDLTRRATAGRLRALAGQLRAVVETTGTGASEGRRPEPTDLPGGLRLRDPIATLRANLTPDSAVLRHAVRASVLVAGSDLVVRLAGYAHGYWVPLTVLVVLRPDFATTFQRAVMRVLGTAVGLLLATELLHWLPGGGIDSPWYSITLIALFYFGMRLAGPGNLGLTAVSLSALVVVLLAVDGVAPRDTLVDRSVATVVGGALALFATLLLPVWERERLPVRLADLLAAYRRYLAVLADPRAGIADRQRARAASRRARTGAQTSLDRARAEPGADRATLDLGEGVLANSHRVVHALMTVDSVRSAVHGAENLPGLAALLQQAGVALRACEDGLRAGSAPRGVPTLRPLQEQLYQRLSTEPARVGGTEAAGALADASDRLANAIDTLVGELRRHFATGATAAPDQSLREVASGR